MLAFLSSHLQPILTVAFICGSVPWILKILDQVLSDRQKRAFDDRIKRLVPLLPDWRPDQLYQWIRTRPNRTLVTLFVCLDLLVRACDHFFAFEIIPYGYSIFPDILGNLLFALGYYFAVAAGFKEETLSTATKTMLGAATFWAVVGFLVYFPAGIIVQMFFEGSKNAGLMEILTHRDKLEDTAIIAALCASIFFGPPLMLFLLLVVMSLLRLPISFVVRIVRWIAFHPEGAWAALVVALGAGFEPIRILFR